MSEHPKVERSHPPSVIPQEDESERDPVCAQCGTRRSIHDDHNCAGLWLDGVEISENAESQLQALKAENEHLRAERQRLYDAGMPTDIDAGVGWIGRLIAKCDHLDALRSVISGVIKEMERDVTLHKAEAANFSRQSGDDARRMVARHRTFAQVHQYWADQLKRLQGDTK